jgi:ketosteroid isomerase-like protein
MSIEKNVQVVKEFFAALGRGDRQGPLFVLSGSIAWLRKP